jgi:hypothetical protein
MQMNQRVFCLVPLALLIACQASGPHKSNLDQAAVISARYNTLTVPQGATFEIVSAALSGDVPKHLDVALVNRMVTETIDDLMTDKGFVRSSAASPFLTVQYVLAIGTSLSDERLNRRYDISPGLPEAGNLRKYPKGTLVVDIVHAPSKGLVWRGAAQAYAEGGLPEKRMRANIRAILKRMLNDFS